MTLADIAGNHLGFALPNLNNMKTLAFWRAPSTDISLALLGNVGVLLLACQVGGICTMVMNHECSPVSFALCLTGLRLSCAVATSVMLGPCLKLSPVRGRPGGAGAVFTQLTLTCILFSGSQLGA